MASRMEGDMISNAAINAAIIRGAIENVRKISNSAYDFGGWHIIVTKSQILPSNCYCHKSGTSPVSVDNPLCQVCRFATELSLKHLPEMVFPDNCLKLVYMESGFTIEFNPLDAMKCISTQTAGDLVVASSAHWTASKADTGLPAEILHSYDWTFTTNYKGTISTNTTDFTKHPGTGEIDNNTSERLDLEKLKRREEILFYSEMSLYEDELHDNGISNLIVKLRVMPSGFFILQRFFLRVDQVMFRLCDTRIHFEVGKSYFLREFQTRESSYEQLKHLEPTVLSDPNLLYAHLPMVNMYTEKIKIV